MNFAVLTIFPEMFDLFWSHGIVRRAIEKKRISAHTVNIRDFAMDRHKSTDDRPFGGGCGMLMKTEPMAAAIRSAKIRNPASQTILLTPQGRRFDQNLAYALASLNDLILVCGRYEGVDERICDTLIDFEISIGDYVLTGGELPAMIIMDAVTRLLPDTLGGAESAEKDSFSDTLLEHAHYTRPRSFEEIDVPEVLLSGNHRAIDKWRLESSLIRTFLKRPDLLEKKRLDSGEIDILKKWCLDIEKIIRSQSLHGTDALSGS
ncbi:tRNA (guanine37-N1)-methyltransferase [Desulfosarcina sp. BuS5]|uniref:tRNA (guanosine(37)-N1)-methyltransferase TrmD n=1 Tax=Desulfosarcina sp. BuS5 TaxID=933262 RepID=UPI0004844734|nr:tRNA (guanosine(37)-N1)-methyltransferase TrmD [Desulfosarcina sp. BuS5]WDN90169.1 tRNA (guanine37-N1)-methyltransferase [Desulfosarcina sp. BuS5]